MATICSLNRLTGGSRSYDGTGLGRVRKDAMPEPYGGSLLRGEPRAVFLSLNPGRPYLEFQGRDGAFAKEILGSSFDEFAAKPFVLREDWRREIGRNPYYEARVAFMRVRSTDHVELEFLPVLRADAR